MSLLPATLPSPDSAVWWLGPVPLRAYAACILLGILAAILLTRHRLRARGGTGEEIFDVAPWAILLGIVGGRLYHVLSSPWPYFGPDGDLVQALRIWDGGLGIWGAVALGAVGAWIGCRRHGHSFLDLADALAPGLLVAQAIGRWGNWFNNELYGGPAEGPWALTIHEWDQAAGRAVTGPDGQPVVLGTFQPTFLYESVWCLVLALGIVLLDRRVRLHRGQALACYIAGYTLGRFVVELMRTDPAQIILGQRINAWVSLLVCAAGVILWWLQRRAPLRPGPQPVAGAPAESTNHRQASSTPG